MFSTMIKYLQIDCINMKAKSGHIIIPHKSYKDLLPFYDEIYTTYLNEIKQDVDSEEARVYLEIAKMDLENNRKPVGFNKPGSVRFIFPIRDDGTIEFYFARTVKSQEVVNITMKINDLLNSKNIAHKVEYDKLNLSRKI